MTERNLIGLAGTLRAVSTAEIDPGWKVKVKSWPHYKKGEVVVRFESLDLEQYGLAKLRGAVVNAGQTTLFDVRALPGDGAHRYVYLRTDSMPAVLKLARVAAGLDEVAQIYVSPEDARFMSRSGAAIDPLTAETASAAQSAWSAKILTRADGENNRITVRFAPGTSVGAARRIIKDYGPVGINTDGDRLVVNLNNS